MYQLHVTITATSPTYIGGSNGSLSAHSSIYLSAKGHLVSCVSAIRPGRDVSRLRHVCACHSLQGAPMVPPAPPPFTKGTPASTSLGSEDQDKEPPAQAQPLRLKWTVGTIHLPPPPLLALRGDPRLCTPATAIRDGDGRKGREEYHEMQKGSHARSDPSRSVDSFLAASSR